MNIMSGADAAEQGVGGATASATADAAENGDADTEMPSASAVSFPTDPSIILAPASIVPALQFRCTSANCNIGTS